MPSLKKADPNIALPPEKPTSPLQLVVRESKNTLAKATELALAGEWRRILYWLKMKSKGVDLAFVSVEDLGLTYDHAHPHGNSGGPCLDTILRTLTISPSDECLDFGCGKGGAILTFAKYPFARVDGVEISESLVRVARKNLDRMGVRNSKIFHRDAAEFTDLDRYTLFYMYYPFPRSVTKMVLENISRSLQRRPRTVTLIYTCAEDHDLMLAQGFRVEAEFRLEIHRNREFACYVYRMEG